LAGQKTLNISLAHRGANYAYFVATITENPSAMTSAKKTVSALLLLSLFFFLLPSCQSPVKLLETGDYDKAIQVAVKKLAGKKNKNPQHIDALARALHLANTADVSTIRALKAENKPETWERILRRYEDIQSRQRRVAPLLPLTDKHGVLTDINIMALDEPLREARQNTVSFHYNQALEFMAQARRGDRFAARQAFQSLTSVDRFYREYREKESLKTEALMLGKTRILVRVYNQASVTMPSYLEENILRMPVKDLDSQWREYLIRDNGAGPIHYEVKVNLVRIETSPESMREREYEDVKQIEDGFEYVLDSKGNVTKDSLGNDIKVPKKITIKAKVLEVLQRKAAFLECRVEFFDNTTGALLQTWPVAAESVFENYASTFSGDRRALSDQSLARIGNRPQPFPPDDVLLEQAAEKLKPIIKQHIARTALTE
jgi:hypothetical protein